MIPMPISEIADRYSICVLKRERTGANMLKEIQMYIDEIIEFWKTRDNGKEVNDIFSYAERLYNINAEIWDLESDIRKGREGELGLEEVGRRAIKIRDLNKKRVAIKNEIVEEYGEGFKDIKINHASDGE